MVRNPEADSEELEGYKAEIKAGVVDPLPYERLMIAYRKEKNYKEELRIINKGIAVFEKKYKAQQKKLFTGSKNRKNIEALSTKINKQTGLTGKTGDPVYIPEPLNKWMKRKKTVIAKMENPAKTKKTKK